MSSQQTELGSLKLFAKLGRQFQNWQQEAAPLAGAAPVSPHSLHPALAWQAALEAEVVAAHPG